jgi:hypothetical protein
MRAQRAKRQRCYNFSLSACLFLIVVVSLNRLAQGQINTISGPAYELLNQRTSANQNSFYVYLDQDSGFNHGFPSGFFASSGNLSTIHIDSGCIDDPTSATGCSTNPNVLDRTRGTVLSISFDPQTGNNFAGVNIEEPENWGVLQAGTPYDLSAASSITFDVRSPNGAMVQFGVGGCVTPYTQPIPSQWTTISIALNTGFPSCIPDLANTHILFAVATNVNFASQGAKVLLDNIRFTPIPIAQQSALGFPLSNQTFGVLPQQAAPVPLDQVLRNLTTVYESALVEISLLARGTTQDIANAKLIADTFDYALHHENHGDPLPVAQAGSSFAIHNGYESGDIALFNNQQLPRQGHAGDVRLAGFTATTLCSSTGFCLVLDGTSGGNASFSLLALVAAYNQFGDVRYLNDAVMIGNWIVGNLEDTTGTGYGGYYVGYPDMGVPPPKPLQTGKSVENAADIFAALTALANVESQLGNPSAATSWTSAANIAGDFVMQMYDPLNGRFNVGTVPSGTASAAGLCPTGSQKGNDVINVCDFLDSNTFTTLAMAEAPRYRNLIDWRKPVQYALNNFSEIVTAGGLQFQGFDIVPTPDLGPNGAAWEFTGQAVETMLFVDKLYTDTHFESSADAYLAQIEQAQTSAPFEDGLGLVAATLQDGDKLNPSQQCLQTPYQCIAERVGLAATAWSILAEQKLNVFNPFPMPSFLPTSLSFSGQPISTPSPSQTITLTNAGNIALLIKNVVASGDFTVATSSTTCSAGQELSAGASCAISVTFTPTAAGTRTGAVSLFDNAASSPQSIALSGAGLPIETPTVFVTPSASSITTTQALALTIAISGGSGYPTPTGMVRLTSGSYTSSGTPLSSGTATINLQAGSLAVGNDTLTVNYTPDTTSSSIYNSASGTASVTVARATPIVAVAPSSFSIGTAQTLSVTAGISGGTGASIPTGAVTLSGGGYTSAAENLMSGGYTFAIPASSLSAGTDTLIVSYNGDSNYLAAIGTASVLVTQSIFSMAASTPTAVNPGAAATSTVSVSATTGYAGTVTITCALTSSPSGATQLPTCSNGSSTITLSGATTTGTATVTVGTTAATTAMSRPSERRGRGLAGACGGTILAFLVFLGIPARRRCWRAMLGMLVLMAALGGMTACGGSSGSNTTGPSNPGTTPGTYTFTVTGTGSPSISPIPTTTFNLTVN